MGRRAPVFVVLLVTVLLPACAIAGDAGLGQTLAATVLPDSAPGFVICGTAGEDQPLTLTCENGGQIVSIDGARYTILQFGSGMRRRYGTWNGACSPGLPTFTPVNAGSKSCSSSGVTGIVQTACLNKNTCTLQASNAVFGDPCSGYYKRLYVIATCTNSRAASGHHIHRHTDGSLYYTTSRSVLYVAPQNSPGALPTTVLNLGGSGTTGFLRQSTYAKFWIFGPNSYFYASEANRIYQFTSIPTTSAISLNNIGDNAAIPAMTPSTKITGIAHATRTVNGNPAYGTLAYSTETSGFFAFTRSESNSNRSPHTGTPWVSAGTRPYPECGSTTCYRGTQASLVRTFAGDAFQTIVFGTSTGRIFAFSADDTTANLGSGMSYTAGAGSVSAMEYGSENNVEYLYVASVLGFVFQFDWTERRIASLLLFQPLVSGVPLNVEITALFTDNESRVLYFGAGDGVREAYVARVNLGNTDVGFDAMDSYRIEPISNSGRSWAFGRVKALFASHATNQLAVLTDQPIPDMPVVSTAAVGTHILLPSVVNCGQYNCSTCGVTDRNLCGYCATTDTCSPLSVFPGGCPAESQFSQPAACPTILSLNVTSGPITGGTIVKVTGNNFLTTTTWECLFGTLAVPASGVTSTSMVCVAPPTGAPIPATVSLRFAPSKLVSSSISFDYYDCTAQSCSSCFARAECVWCYSASQCQSSSVCTGPSTRTSCPALTSITPTSSSLRTSTTVTLASSNIPLPALQYSCGFGPGVVTQGSIVGNNVECSTPTNVEAGVITPELRVGTPTSSVPYTIIPTPNVVFDLYNCTTSGACFQCLNNHPACKYCGSGCAWSDDGCTSEGGLETCPTIFSVSRPYLHLTESNVEITITVAKPNVGSDPNEYQCYWTSPSALHSSAAALAGSTTSVVKCTTPIALELGDYSLEIRINSKPYTNPATVSVYDCAPTNTCSKCFSTTRPLCRWCHSGMACQLDAGCATVLNSETECPTLNMTQTSATVAGGETLRVKPSLPPADTSAPASCVFGSIATTSAAWDSTLSEYLCQIPPASPATVDFTFTVSGVLFAPKVSFQFYDCRYYTGGTLLRQCSDCANLRGCNFCGATCVPSTECSTVTPSCPKLVSVSPDFAEISTPRTITIKSSPPAQASVNYQCVFNVGAGVSVAATVVGGEIQCITPTLLAGALASVKVAVVGEGLWADGTSLTFEFFSCSPLATTCGQLCFASNRYCGFCLDSGSCTGEQSCLSTYPGGTWLNSTVGCPELAEFEPNHLQLALLNVSEVEEQITLKMSNLILSDSAAKAASASDFECVFGTEVVPVNQADFSTSEFTCKAPTFYDQAFYSTYINYKEHRVNSNVQRLQVLDCYSIPACGLCMLNPLCGWCPGSVRCMTKGWCAVQEIPTWIKTCPTLRTISPSFGYMEGGETFTLSGGPFVYSNYSVLFTPQETNARRRADGQPTEVPAVWVSEQEITFVSPPLDPGSYKVVILLNGEPYAQDDISFSFLEPPAAVNVPLAASLAAVFGLLLIAGIIALIVMRRQRVGFFSAFELKEPDYALVAFGALLSPLFRFPKDNYDILGIHLLAKDHALVLSVIASTAPTEQDVVARALTFFYDWHHRSVEFGTLFITDEIGRNKSENTIFRNNSMASKWFKYYSKIVGIKYLFITLARFIVELDKISESSMKAKQGGSGQTTRSLLSMEMEVDPDKYGDNAFTDSEANVYQLILTCQKIFTAIRSTVKEMPREFKQLFQALQQAVVDKFGSEDAVLKAIGGFLFLRFIGPALTAPHAYGLLESPPNPVCQRQLVLIGKVMQNLANMTLPGTKEQFMNQLRDFFERNIPKMKEYYYGIIQANYASQDETNVVSVPDVARNNALAQLWDQIKTNEAKVEAQIVTETEGSPERTEAAKKVLRELHEHYPKKPRKITEAKEKTEKN